jgi:hypothetical protein
LGNLYKTEFLAPRARLEPATSSGPEDEDPSQNLQNVQISRKTCAETAGSIQIPLVLIAITSHNLIGRYSSEVYGAFDLVLSTPEARDFDAGEVNRLHRGYN